MKILLLIIFITQVFFCNTYAVEFDSPSLEDVISSINRVINTQDAESKPDISRNKNMEVVCTKSFHSNFRKGPGTSFPIKFEILVRGYPLKVIKYVDTWYAVEDVDGEVVWVSQINIKKSCGVIVKASGLAFMYIQPARTSKVIMSLERGLIINDLECFGAWCQVQINKQTGWIERENLWGNVSK
ncbi:MAG: SH3-like domain-containing protein [Candidatus Deianiraeaceae bacterium]|jgi:SH3-like domain-containing protein